MAYLFHHQSCHQLPMSYQLHEYYYFCNMVMTKTKRKSKIKPQQIIIRSIKDYNEKIKDIGILKDSISIYTRVSTKGQIDNFSIKDQIQKGLKYISSNHNDIKYIIIWRE